MALITAIRKEVSTESYYSAEVLNEIIKSSGIMNIMSDILALEDGVNVWTRFLKVSAFISICKLLS